MSQVKSKNHGAGHAHKPHPKKGGGKPAAPITNFNQQAMDQAMQIMQMKQAQMIQQFTARMAALQLPQEAQPTPEQTAAQAAAEARAQAEAAARQAQFDAYSTQALSQFNATSASMQATFASSMQGFGSLEASLGGFLNQGFAPAQFNGGSQALVAGSNLFSGPISVPQFYPGLRGLR